MASLITRCPFRFAYRYAKNKKDACRKCGNAKGHSCSFGGINVDHIQANGNKDCFYPYDLHIDDLKEIVRICEALEIDCDVSVDSNSEYFNGAMRVHLHEPYKNSEKGN